MDDMYLVTHAAVDPVVVQPIHQLGNEGGVDLDGIELVPWQHPAQELSRHRSCARADFQYARGAARLGDFRDQRSGQEPAAGQNRAGGSELTAALAEEFSAFIEVAHPRPRLGMTGKAGWSQAQIAYGF